jgi:NAD(P)H-dependent flavin oxidoreductase YrpB (nitropropane dioxygenase family)
MLKTPLCDLLGIEVPIILAPMGTCTSAEFAAAVSNEGGLGGIGSLFRSTEAVKRTLIRSEEAKRRAVALADNKIGGNAHSPCPERPAPQSTQNLRHFGTQANTSRTSGNPRELATQKGFQVDAGVNLT